MSIDQSLINNVAVVMWAISSIYGLIMLIGYLKRLSIAPCVIGLGVVSALTSSPALASESHVEYFDQSRIDPWDTEISTPNSVGRIGENVDSFEGQKLLSDVSKASENRKNEENYRIVLGDNLWDIAKSRSNIRESHIELWRRIIAENSLTLRSKDPSLIYPGEIIVINLDGISS